MPASRIRCRIMTLIQSDSATPPYLRPDSPNRPRWPIREPTQPYVWSVAFPGPPGAGRGTPSAGYPVMVTVVVPVAKAGEPSV